MSADTLEFYVGSEVLTASPSETVAESTKRRRLGQRCAELYIEAQGLCRMTSDAACDLADSKKGDIWFKLGFNERMSKTTFAGRIVD